MNNYVIISASTSNDLMKLVNDNINLGYKPIGGVTISKGNGIYSFFYQAMVKESLTE